MAKVIQQTPETALLTARIEDLRKNITLIGRDSRFAAGLWVGFVKGLAIGIFVSLLLAGLGIM
ncbi:tetrahydromethanopterin S-methyltransferase subunit F [ANME-1 cluster archaeon ex4572_4]|nr:tetrahydromethanopterin S-methyltransferase subunit F [Methanophagales archaeon]OYT67007.1 MAG: tetrahydromethanopterin S-methyltransferase subunit F [ANME-1 cluster archaeon ex4572_4]PXF51006.1 MAG: tetrahydromethanopterin S-methyltransferase subunit F [Methanophagales archaeon]